MMPIPEKIVVNGQSRPTHNSEGRPIHTHIEGIANFWRWFGDDGLFDETGRPQVVYHGSKHSFAVFNTDGKGKTTGAGAFFSSDKETAATYGPNCHGYYLRLGPRSADVNFEGRCWNRGPALYSAYTDSGDVIETYESEQKARSAAGPEGSVIDFPLVLNADGDMEPDFDSDGTPESTDSIAATARQLKFSSIVIRNVVDVHCNAHSMPASDVFVVFSALQIKAAYGNSGAFNADEPSVYDAPTIPDIFCDEAFGNEMTFAL